MAQGKCIQCKKGYDTAFPGEEEEDKCDTCKQKSVGVAAKIDREFEIRKANGEFNLNPRAKMIQDWLHGDPNKPIIVKASDIQNGQA